MALRLVACLRPVITVLWMLQNTSYYCCYNRISAGSSAEDADPILSGMNRFPQLLVSVVAVNCELFVSQILNEVAQMPDREIIKAANALICATLAPPPCRLLCWGLLASQAKGDDWPGKRVLAGTMQVTWDLIGFSFEDGWRERRMVWYTRQKILYCDESAG